MNSSRNLLLFLAGAAVLFGLQILLMRHYAPKTPPQQAAAVSSGVAPQVVQTLPAAVSPASTTSTEARKSSPLHEVEVAGLKLSFDAANGALRQAMWMDGTPFFTPDFPGVGGATATFDKVEDRAAADATTITFSNGAGDHLSYHIPAAHFDKGGRVVEVAYTSVAGRAFIPLTLPDQDKEAAHLGRALSVVDGKLHDVVWTDILHDPFFSFAGAKRKELPPASTRLGADAGVDLAERSQRNHYFAALWDLPSMPATTTTGYSLAPGAGLAMRLYLGPQENGDLKAFDPAYTSILNFGFFGSVAKLLFVALKAIQKVVPDWGWAIVIFTVLLRLLLWPLNSKQIMNMLRMKDFEPHQKALQEKYKKFGSDMAKKAEMQKELMELYKKNGHNPLGGCLPMLVQMPVLFALWSMLLNVYDIHKAPWHPTWIHDLSMKDPYYIIPVLMGASMIVQQMLTPTTGVDPTQRKMMMFFMPVFMVFIFAQTPAGLTLYYLIYNLMGLIQTWAVMRSYESQPIKV
ncbi:MAG TPA: membrane protein insertase YidC [Holophagaceae bacterium]|jgi:YidC/Oxa1 family membrane protein insertase|nr:membrane protein insertase YidC [Holophagaceae bacterium]